MIMMYTKSQCPQCVIAKAKLNLAGVAYTEVFVDRDTDAMKTMIDAGHRSVPIFYANASQVSLEYLLNKKE